MLCLNWYLERGQYETTGSKQGVYILFLELDLKFLA